jgi:hypothetical protein
MDAWRSHRKYERPIVTEEMCWTILKDNEIEHLF